MEADGFGFCQRVRAAEATALTGFQSAMVRSTGGIRWVGTSALETMARGKRITSPTPWADSGPLEMMPRQAQPQDSA